jgi:hypothetical protein
MLLMKQFSVLMASLTDVVSLGPVCNVVAAAVGPVVFVLNPGLLDHCLVSNGWYSDASAAAL